MKRVQRLAFAALWGWMAFLLGSPAGAVPQ